MKALVLLELEALLGHVQAVLVILLELLTQVVFDAAFFFLHATVGFDLVALTKDRHFAFKAHQMLISKPALFSSDGFAAFFCELRFHGFTHFAFDLLKGALALVFVP